MFLASACSTWKAAVIVEFRSLSGRHRDANSLLEDGEAENGRNIC